ncbi:MAG: hypothetical protein DBY32_11315 [Phascolarctobacterium sp.]|nr:MAG: hypothetical protein DBY32_11315 [Phascolarctobacterium sp.]
MFDSVIPLLLIVTCTAYTASYDECGKTDGITASGVKATQGRTVAADDLPFGTKVIIDGHTYTVDDRFGGGYKNRIDIYMNNKEDAYKFGRQVKVVQVIENKKEESNAKSKTNFLHS